MEDPLQALCRDLNNFRVKRSDFKVEKLIAQGGFGKVFLAIYIPNGCRCAVKELNYEKLEGRDLQFFIREVRILACCDNYFLLPFIGFTAEYPFTIVTEYVPNGSLFEALHSETKVLDGTQKTIIAMGIACGMARLHSLGIIHRDIKSLNILLDANNYPKICDFGISRFRQEANEKITQQIGTPHWMAPEMYDTQTYTNKVDVYAYAILLWEVLTQQTPFKGLSAMQIMNAVCIRNERPAIPPGTPEALQKVIQLCWHPDPEKRPTFERIFKLFKSGKAFFAGCDKNKVTAALKEIEASAKAFQSRGIVLSGAVSMPKQISDPINISPQQKPTVASIYGVLVTGNQDLIDAQLHQLNQDTYAMLFESVFRVLSTYGQPQIVRPTLIGLLKILVEDPPCLHQFVSRNLHLSLPFDTEENAVLSLSILIPVFQKMPGVVTVELVKTIVPYIALAPLKVIRLFALYCVNFEVVDNPWKVADILILRAVDFIKNGAAIPLMETLIRLLKSYRIFYEGRLDNCVHIFVQCLGLRTEMAKTAYACLASLKLEKIDIEPNILTTHVSSTELHTSAVKLLATTQVVKGSPELVKAVAARIHQSECAVAALGRLAAVEPKTVFEEHARWMNSSKLNPSDQLRVLMTLCLMNELRPYIAKIQELPAFLARVTMNATSEILSAVSLLVRRLPLSAATITNLSTSGFVRNYVKAVVASNEFTCISNCFLVIDTLCRKQFVRDFLDFLPCVMHLIATAPQLHEFSMSYLLLMSSHPEAAAELKAKKIKEHLSQMNLPPNLNKYINSLSHNIDVSIEAYSQ